MPSCHQNVVLHQDAAKIIGTNQKSQLPCCKVFAEPVGMDMVEGIPYQSCCYNIYLGIQIVQAGKASVSPNGYKPAGLVTIFRQQHCPCSGILEPEQGCASTTKRG